MTWVAVALVALGFAAGVFLCGALVAMRKEESPVVRDVVRLITDDTLPVNGRLLLIHKVIHEELAKEVK